MPGNPAQPERKQRTNSETNPDGPRRRLTPQNEGRIEWSEAKATPFESSLRRRFRDFERGIPERAGIDPKHVQAMDAACYTDEVRQVGRAYTKEVLTWQYFDVLGTAFR